MRLFIKVSKIILPLLVVVTALSVICPASGGGSDGTEVENRLKKAVELISRQSYKEAEDILLAMEGDGPPGEQKVYFLLGRLYMEEGSLDKAETFLSRAADDYPLLRDYILKLLADAYALDGKFEDVIAAARRISNKRLVQYAKQSEINALLSLKREKEAEDALFQYVEDYPLDWDNKFTLAKLLKNKGEADLAVRLLKEIYVNAAPLSVNALSELVLLKSDTFTKDEILKRAEMLFEQNNFQRAEKEYQNALKLAGNMGTDDIRFSIGMCQFRLKQYDKASRSFGMVRTPEALYYRGWSFYRMDDREGFEKVKEEFKRYYPDDERLALLLLMEAEEFRRSGSREDAVKNYREVLDSFPAKKEDALWGAGWMHYTSGEYTEAQQYFSQLAGYKKSDNYYKYLYWNARAHENVVMECLKRKASAQLQDPEKCDGEGQDFFSEMPSDNSFYGYLIKMHSQAPVSPEKIKIPKPSRPDGQTYDRIEALALLGMKDEAVNEIIDSLRQHNSRNDLMYLGKLAMELGEYRNVIAFAERETDTEFLPYAFPFGFADVIEETAASQHVDKYLVAAVIREESRFDPDIVSWAGAIGLMQLMPATAYRLNKDVKLPLKDRSEIHDVQKNINLGTYYLSNLLHEFGEVPLALAAYNAGENTLGKWLGKFERDDLIEFIENIPYRETRFYVKKVLRSYWQYREINGLPLKDFLIRPRKES